MRVFSPERKHRETGGRLTLILSFSLAVFLLLMMALPGSYAGVGGREGSWSLSAEEKDVATGADSPYRLGLIRTPPGEYRQVETPFSVSSYTASIDLSSQIPPVGDQGRQGSCVAWATGYYYKSWWEKQEHSSWDLTNSWYQFSPSFIYNQINGGKDQGSTFYDAFKLLESKGAVDIAEMPYNQNDYTTQPTSAQLEAAKPYRIPSNWAYFWIRYGQGPFNPPNDIDACKSWLASGKLLVMGIPIYNDFPGFGGTPPEKYYDYNETASLAGGHGVCIVGYDDNVNLDGSDPDHRGGFKMVNSWGVDWNGENRGFIYLSYDFVKRYVWEAWTMQDNAPDSPSITSLSSYSGRVGDTIHIYGNNFGTYRRNARVSFNGVNAQSVSYTNEDITVTIPPGATSGPLIVYDWEGTPTNSVNFTVTTGGSAPHISYIDPTSGQVGTTVNINGTSFGSTRGSSYVSFGSVQATDYPSWSDTQVRCRVPSGVSGEVQVTVTTGGGTSNGAGFFVSVATFYFAEGYTGRNFQEYLCIGNLGRENARVKIVYIFSDGSLQEQDLVVQPNSRTTVDVNRVVGQGRNVSAVVMASCEIVAERPMYFNYKDAWTGGHDVIGIPSPSQVFYFAEGYTGSGFEEYICVLNPGDYDAYLTFRFQTAEAGEIVRSGQVVRAHTRATFQVNELLGRGYQTSLKLESTQPVVAERAMYFDYVAAGSRHWEGGHCVMGATSLSKEYFFAEGTTRGGFEEWLTLQNSGSSSIVINAVYQVGEGQGSAVFRSYVVGAGRRSTVFVPSEVGWNKDVSIQLTSSSTFLAERPMYFCYGGAWEGGHCVIGSPAPSSSWSFAEGYTGTGFVEYLCLQNPGAQDAVMRVSYYKANGEAIDPGTIIVPAGRRVTITVNSHAGQSCELACRLQVISGPGIMAERAMYFNFAGWDGGHDVVGFPH